MVYYSETQLFGVLNTVSFKNESENIATVQLLALNHSKSSVQNAVLNRKPSKSSNEQNAVQFKYNLLFKMNLQTLLTIQWLGTEVTVQNSALQVSN